MKGGCHSRVDCDGVKDVIELKKILRVPMKVTPCLRIRVSHKTRSTAPSQHPFFLRYMYSRVTMDNWPFFPFRPYLDGPRICSPLPTMLLSLFLSLSPFLKRL